MDYAPPPDYDSNFYLKKLILPILLHKGYSKIEFEKRVDKVDGRTLYPDIIAEKDSFTYYMEFKSYRGLFNDAKVIRNAIEQINRYKFYIEKGSTNTKFGIILLCSIDEELKRDITKKYGVFVWDIKNLLYMCNDNSELMLLLQQIIPYSLNGVSSVAPLDVIESADEFKETVLTDIDNEAETLISRLGKCDTGREHNACTEYENVCSDIIKYLFETEFSNSYLQLTTDDGMFRMDMLCTLKGTTTFWTFLAKYYRTKFVVFEFKNLESEVDQNLIYITEKYLFNPALRNVAVIVSRKGFNNNAKKAALGILKEQGKLIINITDADLIEMINLKKEGKEPSDYMFQKVEKMLIGISV